MGVLGDVARNIEEELFPYCDEIMQLLILNLGSHEVREVQPRGGEGRSAWGSRPQGRAPIGLGVMGLMLVTKELVLII